MDKSVYEARWLLAPALGLYLGIFAFGFFIS